MASIWSAQTKHGLWRRLWVALAEAERELGLDIKPEQIEQLRGTVDEIDLPDGPDGRVSGVIAPVSP